MPVWPKNRNCGVNLAQDERQPGNTGPRCRRRSVAEFFIDFDAQNAAIPVCGLHWERLQASRRCKRSAAYEDGAF